MNWTGVTFTPVSGTAVTYTGVTSVSFDPGGSLAKFSADGDRYNTTVINDFNEPTATVQCADLAAIRAYPIGTVGTLVAIHNDARNGTGSGSMTYTLSNAVISAGPTSGAHKAFGQGSITFVAYSVDGVTNPLSVAVAS